MGEAQDSKAAALPVTTGPDRQQAAERIIRNNAWWSVGAGVIPLAYVDMAAISLVQLRMLKQLAKLYGVPFDAHRGKSAAAVLIGGIVPIGAGYGFVASSLFQSFVRSAPGIGPVLGIATVGGFAAAATYAVGRVFDQHFASGGTFLSFDPKKVEAYFREQFAAAKSKGAAVFRGA